MTTPATEQTTSRRGLVIGILAGAPVMAYGVRGALVDARLTEPAELFRWALGAAVVNDLLVIPLAGLVGLGARRVVPAIAWPAVRWALFTSAVLGLISWPFVRGYGQDPLTPSLLPRDYAAGVLAAMGVVWAVAGLWILARIIRDPRDRRSTGEQRPGSTKDRGVIAERRTPRRGRR